MNKLIMLVVFSLIGELVSAQQIRGSWRRELDTAVQYLTIVDNYFSIATYDLANKKFIQTRGGTALLENNKMQGIIEFNSSDKTEVKKSYEYDIKSTGKKLLFSVDGISKKWDLVDHASDGLSGNWRISGREQGGKFIQMNLNARKTIKILSGTRFQWIAINTETGEFFGTGGGAYNFADGQYTEIIEFFSRDASRVGVRLRFNAELKDEDWHHAGLSSKGDKINEVWTRK